MLLRVVLVEQHVPEREERDVLFAGPFRRGFQKGVRVLLENWECVLIEFRVG